MSGLPRASLKLTPLGGTVAGAWFGACLPACLIGMAILATQLPDAPRWFTWGLGFVSGPLILIGELGDLATGAWSELRILPWALPAAVLGGWLGRRMAAPSPANQG